MATLDEIRSGFVDRIMSIKNKEFLVALDKLISSSAADNEILKLAADQKEMLEMSEADI